MIEEEHEEIEDSRINAKDFLEGEYQKAKIARLKEERKSKRKKKKKKKARSARRTEAGMEPQITLKTATEKTTVRKTQSRGLEDEEHSEEELKRPSAPISQKENKRSEGVFKEKPLRYRSTSFS